MLLIQLLLRSLLLLGHVFVLLLLFLKSKLQFCQFATGLSSLILNFLDSLTMCLFSLLLLLSHNAEPFLHFIDLLINTLVVSVLTAQVFDLGFQVSDKLLLLLYSESSIGDLKS